MLRFAFALSVLALFAAGILVFAVDWNGATPESDLVASERDDEAVSRLTRRVDRLARRLDEEIARRETLEETLAGWASDRIANGADPSERDAGAAGPHDFGSSRSPASRRRGFDSEMLVGAGFPRRDIEAYGEILDDVEMRRLALRDRATREGWLRTPRYVEERGMLSDELDATRESFGEEFYDWTLFASGRPNRLRIEGVIAGSPAAEVGLEAGDIVQRYAEARILSVDELQKLTTAGASGASTLIEVQRDGQLHRFYVPRGPLGVRLGMTQQEPSPLR